jgi:hypothetical protein
VGNNTQRSPASCQDDRFIDHKLNKEYETPPLVALINQCNCHIYVHELKESKGEITVTFAIGPNFDAENAKYQLIAVIT